MRGTHHPEVAGNVIVVEKAEAHAVEASFWKLTLMGFPAAMTTLFVSALLPLLMS